MTQDDLNTDENKYSSPYERGLLSIVLKDLSTLIEIRQKVDSNYFLYNPNKIIYTSLCLLIDDPKVTKIDLDSLIIECENKGFNSLGVGVEYLTLLSQVDHDKANLPFYLDKVINAYKKYRLSQCLKHSLDLVEKNASDSDEAVRGDQLIDKVSADLTKLNLSNNAADAEAVNVAERVEEFVLEKANTVLDIQGLQTGIYGFDLVVNGLLPGTLTIIAGKAKAGKSTVLMNIADYVAIESPDPKPVLVISTEMYADEDISRLIAMRAQVRERRVFNGQAYRDPEEKVLIDAAVHQIKEAKIFHRYLPNFNADTICNLISYFKLKHNIGLAIFDYIKMETVRSDGATAQRREDQILGEITNALKMSAGILHIPVVSACQINNRSDLVADSDRIVRYCNALVEFRSKDPAELEVQIPIEDYGTHWLHVTYCRSGSNKKIPITFYKPCSKILEAKQFHDEEAEEEASPLISPRATELRRTERFREVYTPVEGGASALDLLENRPVESQTLMDDDDLF